MPPRDAKNFDVVYMQRATRGIRFIIPILTQCGFNFIHPAQLNRYPTFERVLQLVCWWPRCPYISRSPSPLDRHKMKLACELVNLKTDRYVLWKVPCLEICMAVLFEMCNNWKRIGFHHERYADQLKSLYKCFINKNGQICAVYNDEKLAELL